MTLTAIALMSDADGVFAPPRRRCAAAVACRNVPSDAKTASGERQALSKPEEIVHEIQQVVSKLAHEIAAAFDAAAKDLLVAILGHMEHHSDDAWFAQMQDKIEHAKTNADLSACAAEMIKHVHGDGH